MFHNMNSKNDQDSYLSGLITVMPVQRRRSRVSFADSDGAEENRNQPGPQNIASFKYKIRLPGKEVDVCVKAFRSIFGVTEMQIRRIRNSLAMTGYAPKDGRGKHTNRPRKNKPSDIEEVMAHISSFKGRQSHYTRRLDQKKVYLPSELNVKKMYRAFRELHPTSKVSYFVYYDIFRTRFNISFSYPRCDTCTFCDETQTKLNQTDLDESKKKQLVVERDLHQAKAKAFYDIKRNVKAKCQSNPNITAIAFDFMQNLPLPNLTTNTVFYSRQLWHYVFGVHDIGSGDVSMYTYHEGMAKRGQNEVTSMIFNYLKEHVPGQMKEIWLFSDGCPGQNKNYVFIRFVYILVHVLKLASEITHVFPIRGHSYLPCDSDFSLISREKKVVVDVPEEWNDIIRQARTKPSAFNVVNAGTDSEWFLMSESLNDFFLKAPKPKISLKPARMYRISQQYPGQVLVRQTYHGYWTYHTIAKPKKNVVEITLLPNKQKNKINLKKFQDLMKLTKYLKNPHHKDFYLSLQPNSEEQENILDAEILSDDNSSGVE